MEKYKESKTKNNLLVRAFKISMLETKSIVFSNRWIAISILSYMLLLYYLKDIIAFAKVTDLYISPVVFPFLYSDYKYANMAMMIVVFLVSAYPIRNEAQNNLRLRSGNDAFILGQLFSVFCVVFLYLIELQLISLLAIGNRCLFGGWGKVWGAIISGKASECGFSTAVSVSMNIILYTSPMKALLISSIVVFFTAVAFAEIIFLLDVFTGKNIGEVILVGWSFLCIVLSGFNFPLINKIMMVANPAAWLNISAYCNTTDRFMSVLTKMIICVVVLGLFIYQLMRRKDV